MEVEDSIGHSLQHSLNHIVTGKLIDQPGSIVDGQLRNGIFSGSIYSPVWGNYYVEHQRDKQGVTHSVLYHESEIKMPEVNCMEMRHSPSNSTESKIKFSQSDSDIYQKPMAHFYDEAEVDSDRHRREANLEIEEEKQNTCILLIHVDHMFTNVDKFRKPNCKGCSGCTDREEILSFIDRHVKERVRNRVRSS